MKKSAGILIQYKDKFLIVKSTGFPTWGIPKGGVGNGESEIDAAIRETFEETNIYLTPEEIGGELIRYNTPKKEIVVFYHHATFQYNDLKCNSFLEDGTPEIDEFLWATRREALELVKNHMGKIFQEIVVL
ncbi:MAG: NUDIX domain-containing protein [Sulfurimonas sp.]|jgi:8-oxo-dGTP pyrophosphatase MutT (NUDIX family)